MNSYPHEFLAHPQPLMFVAGLSQGAAAGTSSSNTTRDRSSSVLSASSVKGSSRRPSHSALDPNFVAGSVGLSLTSPLTSPGPSQSQLPQSPPVEELADDPIPPELDERDREFDTLLSDLRGALAPLGERSKVWIPEDQRKGFRIVLVDKGVRLPLRKIAPPAGTPDNVPHSPLSPITPSSPVHPDGLIAPVWVRKHAELVPSVFVLFLRLYEPPLPPASETAEEKQERQTRDKVKEKEMDDALVREIGDRRKRLGERGIKLTVVLMASAATLDSPSLDPRLSYLRRASQLSAKASLFVLTPVPADQLPDFVQSLQDALYDAAMEYYSSHAKRVRRKRARLPTGQFATQYAPSDKGRPLGAQGWGVRYDWKAGWFAELRGEFDAARRHYEDCWNELAKMFSSTQVLPPRTKRWAEAKVLADCVAIRICRLLLYSDERVRVTGPFFVHMKRYGDLSRGWGIGEETFEFWSWIARQYRIFAELLEMAHDAGVQLPTLPAPVFPIAGPPTGPPTPEYWATPVSSTNPIHALQQPAFYYYTAATCSAQRKKRYEEALELEEEQAGSEAGGYISTAPGFANEKKVDHAGLVVELFSKAYSLLKDQEYSRNHAALFVAFKIAETYCQAGQHEMAMKFFERISATFKKDKWSPIVRQIRTLWYECAQVTGNVEMAARLLMEMMCPHSGVEGEERAALQEDLALLLRTTTPSSTDPVVIEMEHESLLDVQAGFWSATATIPSEAPYQVVIAAPPGVDVSELSFDELHIAYSDGRAETILNTDGQRVTTDYPHVSLGKDITAPLKWNTCGKLVLAGSVSSDVEEDVQVSSAKLVLRQGTWNLHLVFLPAPLKMWHTSQGSFVPTSGLSASVSFGARPQAIKLDVQHLPSAYVGEAFPISVKVSSEDDRELEGQLAVFLQPSGEDDDASTIRVDAQESKSVLSSVSLGKVAAGGSVERVVYLKALSASSRVVDLSLLTTTPAGSTEEMTFTVTIPVVPPFECVSTVVYRAAGTSGGEAVIRTLIKANGSNDILVDSLTLRNHDQGDQRLLATSLDPAGVPTRWTPHTSFAMQSQYHLGPSRRPSLNEVPPPPGELVFAWRSDSAGESTTQTSIPLPALILPITESFISASLAIPPLVDLQQPFRLPLEIVNSHPTHAALISIERGTADAFVWTGDRAGQLELPPNEAVTLEMQAVAVGVTGWGPLPKITVWEGRGEAERREVKIRQDTRGVYVRP